MSSYAESVLADGEQIVYQSHITHWKFLMHYIFAVLFLLGGLAAVFALNDRNEAAIVAGGALVMGAALAAYALVKRGTTELVVTNRRIIAKRGLIARDTMEMNLGKIESIHVSQGILGRIFDYGDVTVVGTGSSPEPWRDIAGPIEMRRKVGEFLQK